MSGDLPETDIRVFLRSRRARITPEQAGLPVHPGVRRVLGLRREEVAQLAGVSVDYYVRLERGRSASASVSVLEAVARALQLNDAERDHLFALAKPTRRRPRAAATQRARPGLLRALHNIADIPALILGHRLDVLATNRLASSFYSDFDRLPPAERNMARFIFLNDAARDLYVDWSETAREIVGMLHLYASHAPPRPPTQSAGRRSVRQRSGVPPMVGGPGRVPPFVRHEALPPPAGRGTHPWLRSFHSRGRPRSDARVVHRRTRITVRTCPAHAGQLHGI